MSISDFNYMDLISRSISTRSLPTETWIRHYTVINSSVILCSSLDRTKSGPEICRVVLYQPPFLQNAPPLFHIRVSPSAFLTFTHLNLFDGPAG